MRTPSQPRRLVPLALAAGAVLLAGGLVRAADDAGVREFLARSLSAPVAEPASLRPGTPTGFVALTAPRGFGGEGRGSSRFEVVGRSPALALGAAPTPLRSMCVRTCDGYAFPLGNLSGRGDLSDHQAGCAAACPGAPVALYTMPAGADDIGRATSLAGQPYARLATAGLFRRRTVPGCACGANQTPIARDQTLRVGDVVARAAGADAVAADESGRRRLVEFRRPGVLAAPVRREVDRLTGTTRREVAEAQFRRDLRVRQAALAAAVGEPRVRLAAVGGFAVLAAPKGSGAVRVVMPSPYSVR